MKKIDKERCGRRHEPKLVKVATIKTLIKKITMLAETTAALRQLCRHGECRRSRRTKLKRVEAGSILKKSINTNTLEQAGRISKDSNLVYEQLSAA